MVLNSQGLSTALFVQTTGEKFMGEIGMTMCHGCKRLFAFNPYRVPIVQFEDGYQGAICERCLKLSNEILADQGLPLLEPLPGAYDPSEE